MRVPDGRLSSIDGVAMLTEKAPFSSTSVNQEDDQLTAEPVHSFGPPLTLIGGAARASMRTCASPASTNDWATPSKRTAPEATNDWLALRWNGQSGLDQSLRLR